MATKTNQLGTPYCLPITDVVYFNPHEKLLFGTLDLVIFCTTLVHSFMHSPLKFLLIKTPLDPQPKLTIDLISTPLLTKFVVGATIISTHVVGIIK
jgi:hypothetical protein